MEARSRLILVSVDPVYMTENLLKWVTVSIEDAYKCKRPISVPGISINVRRVKVVTCLHLFLVAFTQSPYSPLLGSTGAKPNVILQSWRRKLLAFPCG
jgi:hypothetical protein